MFNFRKKDETESQDVSDVDTNHENNSIDMSMISEDLEYTNSYLAQIALTLGEIAKQQTIANALHILDSEYNNADSLMNVDEILQKKYALFGSIFVDYQAKQENVEENE